LGNRLQICAIIFYIHRLFDKLGNIFYLLFLILSMIQNSEFDEILRKSWSNRYENQRILFRSTLKFIHMRLIEDTKFKAYFNLQLVLSKLIFRLKIRLPLRYVIQTPK